MNDNNDDDKKPKSNVVDLCAILRRETGEEGDPDSDFDVEKQRKLHDKIEEAIKDATLDEVMFWIAEYLARDAVCTVPFDGDLEYSSRENLDNLLDQLDVQTDIALPYLIDIQREIIAENPDDD